MVAINGYKINGTSLDRLYVVLDEARQKVQGAVEDEYHRLLGVEVTQLVDDISMNFVQRPDVPLLHAAQSALLERVRFAVMGFPVEYNLEATASILTDNKDTYIILRAGNPHIAEAFASSSADLQWYGVNESENEPQGLLPEDAAAIETWRQLRDRYGEDLGRSSLTAMLSGPVSTDRNRLLFEPPAKRAAERARHTYMNRMLSACAKGREIPPHMLMPYLDHVMLGLLSEESQAEIECITGQLAAILPPITLELIEADPKKS